MAEVQPAEIVEGATTGDVQDEIDALSKSPEDRKAANTLSTLGIMPNDDSSLRNKVDQKAVKQAMDRLTSQTSQNGMVTKREVNDNKVVKKLVKVDPAHVAILVRGHSSLVHHFPLLKYDFLCAP